MKEKCIGAVMKQTLLFLLVLSLLFAVGCTPRDEAQEPHTCSFTERNTSEAYIAEKATCQKPASYFYSCKCGKATASLFYDGFPLPHAYENGKCIYCEKEQPDEFEGPDKPIELPIIPLY